MLTSNDGQTYSDWMDYYAQTRVSENRFGVDYGGIDFNAEFEQAKKAQKSYDSLSSKYNRYKDEPSPEQQNRIEADPEKPHLWDLKERFLEDPKGSQGEFTGHERIPDKGGGKSNKLIEDKDLRAENYPNPFSDVSKYTPKPLTRPTEPNDALKFWEHPSPKAVIPIREGSMDNGRGSWKVAENTHGPLQMDVLQNIPGVHAGPGVGRFSRPANENEYTGHSQEVNKLLTEGRTRRLTDEEIEKTTPGSPGYASPNMAESDAALKKIADYMKSDQGKYDMAVAKQQKRPLTMSDSRALMNREMIKENTRWLYSPFNPQGPNFKAPPNLKGIGKGKEKSVWEKYPPQTLSDHFDRWLTETGMVPRFLKWLDNKLNPDAGD